MLAMPYKQACSLLEARSENIAQRSSAISPCSSPAVHYPNFPADVKSATCRWRNKKKEMLTIMTEQARHLSSASACMSRPSSKFQQKGHCHEGSLMSELIMLNIYSVKHAIAFKLASCANWSNMRHYDWNLSCSPPFSSTFLWSQVKIVNWADLQVEGLNLSEVILCRRAS